MKKGNEIKRNKRKENKKEMLGKKKSRNKGDGQRKIERIKSKENK